MFSLEDATGATGSADQAVMKPFLPSARTLGPPGFTPEASPRVCCQTPAGSQGLCPGSQHLRGPSGARITGPVPSGECAWVPRTATWRPGPLAWPLGAPGSCPSGPVVRAQGGESRDLRPAWPPGIGGTAGHRMRLFSGLPLRCPAPVCAERLGEAAGFLASHLCPWRGDSSPAAEAYSLWATRPGSQNPGTHGAFL